MNPDFVGDVMAKEVAELYYSMLPFSIDCGETSEHLLSEYLNGDPFKVSIRPYEHIQKLTVCFHTGEDKDDLEGFHKKLTPLLSLPQRDKSRIHLEITTHSACEAYMLNLLEELRQPVYELMHSGATVTVEHVDENYDCFQKRRYLTSQGRYLREDLPIVDCFTLSAEQWAQEVKGRRPWETPEHFHHEHVDQCDVIREYVELGDPDDRYEDLEPGFFKEARRALKERWGWDDIMEGDQFSWERYI